MSGEHMPVNIGNPAEFVLERAGGDGRAPGRELERDRLRGAAHRRPQGTPARTSHARRSCSDGSRRCLWPRGWPRSWSSRGSNRSHSQTALQSRCGSPRQSQSVTATYDRAGILPRAIDSVLRQTYPGLGADRRRRRLDGRDDEVLARYEDERIRVYRHERNRGATAAKNTGLDHRAASGSRFWTPTTRWCPTPSR